MVPDFSRRRRTHNLDAPFKHYPDIEPPSPMSEPCFRFFYDLRQTWDFVIFNLMLPTSAGGPRYDNGPKIYGATPIDPAEWALSFRRFLFELAICRVVDGYQSYVFEVTAEILCAQSTAIKDVDPKLYGQIQGN